MKRIYFDNAATSWPKPESVYRAIDDYLRHQGVPAGRGSYAQAAELSRQIEQTRARLAQWVDAPSASHVVWTYSGTDSLHLALDGLLRPGDHVVTSALEHNSILRPLRQRELDGEIQVTRVDCEPSGVLDPQAVLDAVMPQTRLVALSHASNVTGLVQPLTEIGRALTEKRTRFLVDAAQTVGHCPVSFSDLHCDMLAAPGHKGLLGPTGTGFLAITPEIAPELRAVRLGGTGTSSESDRPPSTVPSKYEAGNLNVLGIVGLTAGLDFLAEQGLAKLQQHEQQLAQRLERGLSELDGITLFGQAPSEGEKLGVVSFQVAGFDPAEVAAMLDQSAQIQVRAGFHCAPHMHRALETDKMGGTVRVSFGPFNQETEVERLLDVLDQIVSI